jgi:Tol biopolymer transport system component
MSALVSGSRLGHYEIAGTLGVGGMGEVYRATDTRLKRQVALKVLPPSVTADPDRLARFQREAEVLASLNHPNIAGLHGIDESDGVKALVMELVEGPTLAERIAQGPIPVDEALTIARQIAEALAAAHDQNIIHRDLKPANIKLRTDGEVKVLDFGLAKAMDQGSGIGDQGSGKTMLANSPTITSPAMTMHGVILGTAAYMSPEQAAGRPVDRRTDLWAFGVVLMEMLTGRQVFAGESVTDVIASVLKDDPDWKALPASTPPSIHRLLRRCLERDRKKRWPDAAAARLECDDALAPVAPGAYTIPAPAGSRWHLAGALAAGIAMAGFAAWLLWPARPLPTPVANTKFAIELPSGQIFTRSGRHVLALSPDGRHLAYVANNQLNVRSLNDLSTKPIDGTVDADPSSPVFSEDGQWIAFWASGRLKKIPVTGGTPIGLADTGNPFGLSWHGDRILLASEQPRAILEVPSGGGQPKALLEFDASKDELAQSPQLIDGGRALLFTLRTGTGPWDGAAIVVHDMATGQRTTLVDGATDGRLLRDGRLVYTRDATLFAVEYDGTRRAVVGSAVAVQQRILQSVGGFSGASMAAFSDTGSLAYVPDESFDTQRVLLWMSRTGQLQPAGLPARPHWGGAYGFALSPDGKRVAIRMVGTSGADTDVWVADLERKAYSRLTFTGSATDPIWTPDGSRVCYEDSDALMCQPFDGSAAASRLFARSGLSTVAALSPDAASVLLIVNNPRTGFDLWLAPNRPPYDAAPLVEMQGNDSHASLSPDGRWLAYSSEASGADEVYVRPFPDAEKGRWQVSTSGGVAPRFSRDGRELYYFHSRTAGTSIALTLMAARVLPGATFATAAPVALTSMPVGVRGIEPSADGRFLISAPVAAVTPTETDSRQRIIVVQHWREALQSR